MNDSVDERGEDIFLAPWFISPSLSMHMRIFKTLEYVLLPGDLMTEKTCTCVKEIEAIFKNWKTKVDSDAELIRAFTLASVMSSPYLIDVEACRLYKKELLQPIRHWIYENGGSIE